MHSSPFLMYVWHMKAFQGTIFHSLDAFNWPITQNREEMREMRGEGLSLLSYNTAKQLNNCILYQVNQEIWGRLVLSPAPGRRPVVSWPHGSPSQGHSLSPGWNADVQREAVLSTNNVITRSSLLVNNSLKKKKIRFKAIAWTCLIMRFLSGRSEKQFPTALGRPGEHRWLSLPLGGLEMEPCRYLRAQLISFPHPTLDQVLLSPLLSDKPQQSLPAQSPLSTVSHFSPVWDRRCCSKSPPVSLTPSAPMTCDVYEEHRKSPQSCWNKVLEKKKGGMGPSWWPWDNTHCVSRRPWLPQNKRALRCEIQIVRF